LAKSTRSAALRTKDSSSRSAAPPPDKAGREEAEAAVRVLLRYAGEDPDREGLVETPSRVIKAFDEYFSGYGQDPYQILHKTFEETDGYDEMVVLKGVTFNSHCEHHMAPIVGRAHIGYLPDRRVVGISKLARIVEVYARRLQIQEKMTAQIADTLNAVIQPRGVGVVVEGVHHCMSTRGIHKQGVLMVTSRMLGTFRSDPKTRREFLNMIGNPTTRGLD